MVQSKSERLAATGYAEQHLFLWVRMSAFAVSVIDNLYFGRRYRRCAAVAWRHWASRGSPAA
ncbi:hypothetical protein A8926_6449 [Saccharopolyspora spinosa]|uniref:Uncharacterized protein n=1 Tax=Saccharopolyspora spinosa TaxID=60894 RepID=A0A2N3Y685_SACSN|nr:hypothetical protein A8926_6449 [Saccharopolyspora spinosa]